MAASSAGQHNIGLSALLRLPIPIAPVAEMRAALGLFSEQSAACEAYDSAIALALKMAFAQRQNILSAAFSGQLLPQDPNDEPASVLLERIRTQRPSSATAAKRKPGRPAKVAA
jgi:type I restriction enzyme S subunit